MVAAQSGVPHEDVLLEAVKRIYAKGGRVTMLDEENPGAATCLPHASFARLVSFCPFYSDNDMCCFIFVLLPTDAAGDKQVRRT